MTIHILFNRIVNNIYHNKSMNRKSIQCKWLKRVRIEWKLGSQDLGKRAEEMKIAIRRYGLRWAFMPIRVVPRILRLFVETEFFYIIL